VHELLKDILLIKLSFPTKSTPNDRLNEWVIHLNNSFKRLIL